MGALDLVHTWGFALLGAGVLLVAFAVNRFAPRKRYRLRSALSLYGLFALTAGASQILEHLHSPVLARWTDYVRVFEDLFSALTVVNILALLVFEVALPAARFSVVGITADIVVGLGYVVAGVGVVHASGMPLASVITTSAVVSGVLALSLQATLGNMLGGVALQLDGSIREGDWLELPGGAQGKVVAVRWRHTVIETRNWDTIIVPNATLLAQNIVILGKRAGQPVQHRMWVYFNVDFRYPPSQVIDVVRDALAAAPIEGAAEDPKPNVICYDLARDGRESFAYYAVRYWLKDLPNDDPTSSRVRARVYVALKRAGIPLARPAQTLFLTPEENEAAQAQRHKERRLQAIERVDLFESLTPEERSYVAEHLVYAPFAAGETATHQGAVAHWLYVLCAGQVQIRRRPAGGGTPKAVGTIDAPDFFGEMGLMTGEPRTADVVAVTDIECYRLDKSGLQHILEERPEVAAQFSRTLARRRVDLAKAIEGFDDEARTARMATEETRILDRIQEFFGLARTTQG